MNLKLVKKFLCVLLVGTGVFGNAHAVELFHVHGVSFSADGKTLYVPAHYGLVLYENGMWRKAEGLEHDYMGFAATRSALYSSGHPAQGSSLVNPFGLLKSIDGGKTWKQLGMMGEADFHVLGTSYNTGTVYVFNMAPNSKIKWEGLASTSDDGATWRRLKQAGAPAQPIAIAAHPSDANQVAIAAESGLYVSGDGGDSFDQKVGKVNVYSVWFDLNKKWLWYGGTAFSPFLAKLNFETGKTEFVALPDLGRDAIAYITQNPKSLDEYVIATFGRSVYLTSNSGASWKQIAREGQPQ